MAASADQPLTTGVSAAIDRLHQGLRQRQRDDGSWSGHLPSSAVSTGAALVALKIADPVGSCHLVDRAAQWLRDSQASDGTWGDAPGYDGCLNATAIAVAALAISGGEEDLVGVKRGMEGIEVLGGLGAVADKSRCSLKTICEFFLVEAGLYDDKLLALLPHELGLLPRRFWNKLSFTVPGLMAWGLMQSRADDAPRLRRWLSRWAEPRALAYLRDIHEHESHHPTRPGGIEESALMAAVVCFGLAKSGVGQDLVRAYRDYLHSTVRDDGSWPVDRDIEHSVTTYLTLALQESASTPTSRTPQADQNAPLTWIREGQRTRPFAATGAPAGGWGWSRPSGWPDVDDTACAVAALAGATGADRGRSVDAIRTGEAWLRAMQNTRGSWSCFARNAAVSMDAACTVMTAHALIALAAVGAGPSDRAVRRAIRWQESVQRPDGSFDNVWFRGLTAGTARSVEALHALGECRSQVASRARDWLVHSQLADGSWGDGTGGTEGTVEETAWAVLALCPPPGSVPTFKIAQERASAQAGVAWLLEAQGADGFFEPSRVGIYFMGLTYHCDHIADAYALQAMARWQSAGDRG